MCGNEKETFHHFITECPRLLNDRAEIFKDYSGPDLSSDDWSVADVMKFSWINAVEEAYDAYMYYYDEDESMRDIT